MAARVPGVFTATVLPESVVAHALCDTWPHFLAGSPESVAFKKFMASKSSLVGCESLPGGVLDQVLEQGLLGSAGSFGSRMPVLDQLLDHGLLSRRCDVGQQLTWISRFLAIVRCGERL